MVHPLQLSRAHTTVAATVHQLVRVPDGTFTMGSSGGKLDEPPPHTVFLGDYFIDRFEVANLLYVAFLNDVGDHHDTEGHHFVDMADPEAVIRRTRSGSYRVFPDNLANSGRGQLAGRRRLLRLGGSAVAVRSDVGKGGTGHRRTHLPLGGGNLP